MQNCLYLTVNKVFIGAINLVQRSKHLNTEIGLIIDSLELAKQIAPRSEAMVHLARGWQRCRIRYRTARSEEQRMKVELLSLLPLDREL